MYEILHAWGGKCRPDVLNYIKQHVGQYTSLGLVLVPRDDRLQFSTSLIEQKLFRQNRVLRQTLIVAKTYKDNLLSAIGPSFVDCYRRIIESVAKDICHEFDEDENLRIYYKCLGDLNCSDHHLTIAIILYQAFSPIRQRQKVSATLSQKLCEIEKQSRRFIFDLMKIENRIDPSLAEIIDEEVTPLVRIPSYVFKIIITKEKLI